MNKTSLILKYFQKKDLLVIGNKDYQKTISALFNWLIDNDNVDNDITTKYFPNKSAKATIIAKQDGIIAGLEEMTFLLKKYTKLSFNPLIQDGSQYKNGDVIAKITGKSREILAYERTILNILQRMSGIATETARLVTIINPKPYTLNPIPYLASTRKTPWMSLDKKAVAVGGGLTHRLDLSDGILIKDNHLTLVSIETAIKLLTNKYQNDLIEIEVTNKKQASDVIKIFQTLITHNLPRSPRCEAGRQAGHLAIMFDNFTPREAKQTLHHLKKDFDLSSIIFEASGGIDESNILEWAKTGVDIISLGSLTHSIHSANLSLEF